MGIQQKLTQTAQRYSEKVVSEFRDIFLHTKINVYISGSVSYGYCDEMSDIEMEFFLPKTSSQKEKDELQYIIDKYPDFEGVRMSAGLSGWPLEQIVYGDIVEFWKTCNPYQVYELATAMPVQEDMPLINKVQHKISFYPTDVETRLIKRLWLTVSDKGSYNADWCNKREQMLSSHIFLFRSLEAMMRLAYLLNKKYYPHTKWLQKGLGELSQDFGLRKFVAEFEAMPLADKLKRHEEIRGEMGRFMVERAILTQRLVDHAWDIMDEEYYVFGTF